MAFVEYCDKRAVRLGHWSHSTTRRRLTAIDAAMKLLGSEGSKRIEVITHGLLGQGYLEKGCSLVGHSSLDSKSTVGIWLEFRRNAEMGLVEKYGRCNAEVGMLAAAVCSNHDQRSSFLGKDNTQNGQRAELPATIFSQSTLSIH
jgi:hypothetical protein